MTSATRTNASPARAVLSAAASSLLAGALVLTAGLARTADAAAPTVASSSPRHPPGEHRILHHDTRHDVLRFDLRTQARKQAPRNRTTDITTTTVDHQAHRLRMVARVRHLARSGYRLMVAEILASNGSRYNLVVDYSITPIGPRMQLERFTSGQKVPCRSATWSINRRTNRVTASVPSTCLRDPRWVRVGIGLVTAPHELDMSWADDSRARGRIGDRHLRLGPRQPHA